MAADRPEIWLVAGVRTPFVGVDAPFAHRDSLSLSVPIVQAMAARVTGSIDFAVWGAVVVNLGYGNLVREVWLESKPRRVFSLLCQPLLPHQLSNACAHELD